MTPHHCHHQDYQEDEGREHSISESMIAQVGDTIHERVEKIGDDSQVEHKDEKEAESEEAERTNKDIE